MTVEVKVPILPESVADAIIATWHKKPGDAVKREENLVDLETDKVVLEVPSPVDGVLLSIVKNTGDSVTSQELIATIQEGAAAAPAPAAPAAAGHGARGTGPDATDQAPSVRRIAAETGIDPASVDGTGRGGRVTKEDMLKAQAPAPAAAPSASKAVATTTQASTAIAVPPGARAEQRVPMTRLRARIAERMMQSKNSIAMLTSFNEINMKPVMDLRKKYAETFEKVHGVKLGFMSFFVKACTEALKLHPIVNASVDGNDIIYHAYQDIGVAVATDKGLVVPVLRNTDSMSLADMEKAIGGFAKQAREGGLQLEDLQGGTFTITNGGVFGSLFSTPIVNPPQSAILGMHAIKERAIVEDGQVVARPMMYVAISYDHRIIDGKDAVLFLVAVKNFLEDPVRLMLHL
ncbi:MAG: 2-oxoglutarate dehydrogenase complex dihydrolipoyllysine-residue succinyltransferase [Rhodanobacteraceae bacterium]|nr:2-oxoglutarate dehydrogenase complex dihydrolipoyllysine-residue succinyltransferase [Rhodanobacteraceae bacterium]